MRGKRTARFVAGSAAAVLFAGVANLAVAFAGNNQRNFEGAGQFGVSGPVTISSGLAPAIIDTSKGAAHLTLSFDVHRYAGPGHKPYNTAIDLDLSMHVRHVLHINGISDAGFVAGDPTLPATAGNPAFSDAFLTQQTNPNKLVQSPPLSGSTQRFHIHFDPLPANSSASTVAAIVQHVSLPVTIPKCGYYDIETGAYQNNTPPGSGGSGSGGTTSCTCPPPHSAPGGGGSSGGDYFAVLTRLFVRAVSNTCSPTHGVQGITTPNTGAGPGYAAVAITLGQRNDPEANLYLGLILLGVGMVLTSMTSGFRRALALTAAHLRT